MFLRSLNCIFICRESSHITIICGDSNNGKYRKTHWRNIHSWLFRRRQLHPQHIEKQKAAFPRPVNRVTFCPINKPVIHISTNTSYGKARLIHSIFLLKTQIRKPCMQQNLPNHLCPLNFVYILLWHLFYRLIPAFCAKSSFLPIIADGSSHDSRLNISL